MDFKQELKQYQNTVNNELEKYLRKKESPEKILNNAMEYSLMAGGKRLRPILVMATYEIFKNDIKKDYIMENIKANFIRIKPNEIEHKLKYIESILINKDK